ncbi:MAG: hypothetical protein ACJAQ3_001501 [Planctomycetota bacterium]|jgi:hypothetical protein
MVGPGLSVATPVFLGTDESHSGAGGEDPLRLSDRYLPLQIDDVPDRPKPLLELGNPFMGSGELQNPITLPTGAVWSPSLLVWGNFRTGVAAIDRGEPDSSEWANRLDLFAEARLSPTERIVVGLRPFDKNGEFSGFDLDDGEDRDGANLDVRTLFFEGEFGEIFPNLDTEEKRALDFGFGLGRQPLNFQDGILINDIMDSVTVTRNSLRFWGASNFRATALVAWDDIERGGNIEDDNATVFGILTATDLVDNYLEIDVVATTSNNAAAGDGIYAGIGSTQRIGSMNSTFRLNVSKALDDGSAAVDDGVLLTSILSWVPHHTEDNFYVNSFIGVDNFTSAARSPVAGGPLANVGVLFAATGLGTVGAPISSVAREVAGGAVGYQQLFNHGRSQMIYEVGGRVSTDSDAKTDTIALGGRYRRALGHHTVLTLDAFAGNDEIDDEFFGGRVEFLFKF